jgi:hypothetical protein
LEESEESILKCCIYAYNFDEVLMNQPLYLTYMTQGPIFRGVLKIAENEFLASSRLSVRLTVRMEQPGSLWADFHEI